MTPKKAIPIGPRTMRKRLFVRYARHPRYRRCATDWSIMHQNLVRYLAGKFVNRGEPLEDLIQVGTIGLINAIDRFDAERGTKFSTYATPTIVGEIRRYFRDKAWSLKVPRRLQELNQTASKAQEVLSSANWAARRRFRKSPCGSARPKKKPWKRLNWAMLTTPSHWTAK